MQFSVIIPVYNREVLIQRAIDSVLSQEHSRYELIVVDDGSTDKTRETVRGYGNEIQLIKQENAGPGAARNRGIQEAEGEYITFLDSDDQWLPWTLSTFEKAIHRHDHPAFVVGTHIDCGLKESIGDIEKKRYRDRRWAYYYTAASEEFIWVRPPSVAIEAEQLRSVGGFSEKRRINGEDADLWIKLGTAPGFVHIVQPPVSTYHHHADGIVHDPERTYRSMTLLIGKEQSRAYPGGEMRRNERLKVLSRRTRPASITLIRQGHLTEALKVYRETLAWNIALDRWRYIIGFPFFVIASLFGFRNR